ncbi:MAG: hypothetical protein IOMNBAOH_00479 [Rhodocyclaceae bacterium]|nr:hypothetical protein [Rhodocyclaceae bacterium]
MRAWVQHGSNWPNSTAYAGTGAPAIRTDTGPATEEHPFALGQAMALLDAYGERLAGCDRQPESTLAALQRQTGDAGNAKRRSRARNAPKFDVCTYLFGMCGVDLARINSIDTTTALKVIAGVVPDFSRFPSAKHFASWLGLCPGTKISGGKVRRRARDSGCPRAG